MTSEAVFKSCGFQHNKPERLACSCASEMLQTRFRCFRSSQHGVVQAKGTSSSEKLHKMHQKHHFPHRMGCTHSSIPHQTHWSSCSRSAAYAPPCCVAQCLQRGAHSYAAQPSAHRDASRVVVGALQASAIWHRSRSVKNQKTYAPLAEQHTKWQSFHRSRHLPLRENFQRSNHHNWHVQDHRCSHPQIYAKCPGFEKQLAAQTGIEQVSDHQEQRSHHRREGASGKLQHSPKSCPNQSTPSVWILQALPGKVRHTKVSSHSPSQDCRQRNTPELGGWTHRNLDWSARAPHQSSKVSLPIPPKACIGTLHCLESLCQAHQAQHGYEKWRSSHQHPVHFLQRPWHMVVTFPAKPLLRPLRNFPGPGSPCSPSPCAWRPWCLASSCGI